MAHRIRIGLLAVVSCAFGFQMSFALEQAGPKQHFKATSPAEVEQWQGESRSMLFDLMKMGDLVKQRSESVTAIPFNAKVLSTDDREEYTRQEIEIDSTPTRRIKVIVTAPKNEAAPFPAVVCIHGHGGNRNVVYDRKSIYRGFAEELASTGFVTISTDVGQHEVYEDGRTLMGERLWDVLRAADYLTTMKNVDADRMGCAGLSLGGEMTMWLAAMDPRMKVAVSSGFLTTTANLKNGHCPCWDFPGLTENFELSDVYSLIAPRALLCQVGAKEGEPGGFPPTHAYAAMSDIQRAYGVYRSGDMAKLSIHPEGHVFETPEGCRFIATVLKREKVAQK